MIRGDELSIFPDQRAFLARLERGRPPGHPGHPRHDDRDHARRDSTSPIRSPDADVAGDLRRQGVVPRAATRPTGSRGSTTCKAAWDTADDRPAGDAAGLVGAAACAMAPTLRARGRRQLPVPGRRPRARDRLPRRRGAPVRRRAVRVPLRHRPRARRDRRRPPGRRLEQLAVPVVPVHAPGATASSTSTSTTSSSRCRSSACAAPRPRRCASSTRRPRSSPTSSSATTSCNAAARTATPTSACSARSTGAVTSSCARCTAGASTCATGRCLTADDRSLRVRRRESTIPTG